MALPPVGTSYYGTGGNLVVFPTNTETLAFELTPQYDAAGRTVIFTVIKVTLKFRVNLTAADAIGTTTDPQAQAIYQCLITPAMPFAYTAKGFGDIQVNTGVGMQDVLWGPKPQLVSFRHLAGERAIEVTWTVSMALPLCSDAVFVGQPMELNYRLETTIDKSGYSTRRFIGFLRVPQTRATPGSPFLLDSGDAYRESIDPPLMEGFRRVYGPFTLDESKCRLDWSITDAEVGPYFLPEGVIEATAGQRISNVAPGFARWSATLFAEIEVARDYGPWWAWNAFFSIVAQRIQAAQNAVARNGTGGNVVLQPDGTISGDPNGGGPPSGQMAARGCIPIHLEMEEPNFFGKQVSRFSFTYTFPSSLKQILAVSGMYTPVGGDWNTWAVSLRNSAFNIRGTAQLRFNPATDDAIADLCKPGLNVTLTGSPNPIPSSFTTVFADILGDPPAAENSWLFYENRFVTEDGQHVMTTASLPSSDLNLAAMQSGGLGDDTTGYVAATFDNQPAADVQTRAGTQWVVYLVGKAYRVHYQIQPPAFQVVGDTTATPANRADAPIPEGFETWVVGDFGFTVIGARWRMRYVLTNPPAVELKAISTPLVPGGFDLADGFLSDNGDDSNL